MRLGDPRANGAVVLGAAAILVLFVATARYVYPGAIAELPRLTARHVADPGFAGATLRFEGRVTWVRAFRSGVLAIRLHDPGNDVNLETSVFPSLGCLPVKPLPGELARVTGSLGTYQGRPQLRPLSADHVEVVSPEATEVAQPLSATRAAQLGDALLVGPVSVADVEFFTSQAGRRHVRMNFADAATPSAAPVAGVMFEGDWTDCEVAALRSGEPVLVAVEVDEYLGQPSLIVGRVVPLDRS